MRLRVTHRTEYVYGEAVSLSHNVARLRPRNTSTQTLLNHDLSLSPVANTRTDGIDYFGNDVTWFSLQEPHTELVITAQSDVEVSLALRPDISHGPSWEQVRQTLLEAVGPPLIHAREFCLDSPHVQRTPAFAEFALPSFPAGRPYLEAVLEFTERIHRECEFLPGSTHVGTPVSDVLRTKRGVCQDFAHLEITCLRSLGLAARYVSGYIVTIPRGDQPRLAGADVSHAWISVFHPDFGWMDFDPTNGIMPSDGHVTVAWARDYDDVGPVRGVMIGGRRQEMEVSVDVVPIASSN
jgi:transglutaminase-like putative cysteine protease